MGVVNLASGGIDSSLVALLLAEKGVEQHPLFVDYGQRAASREWEACKLVHDRYGLPEPTRVDLSGYGALLPSGLTDESKNLVVDAFLPGRNLLFLVTAGAYAYQVGADSVAIGLLSEESHIFADQTASFAAAAKAALDSALGSHTQVLTPLIGYSKSEVMALAKEKGLSGTYSCHAGNAEPCGVCISCMEQMGAHEGTS